MTPTIVRPRAEVRAGQFVQGVADRVVVQGRGQGGIEAVALAGPDAPLVHPGVERVLIAGRRRSPRTVPAACTAAAVRVERDTGLEPGKDQGAAAAQRILHAAVERAAQEDRALRVQGLQRRARGRAGPATGRASRAWRAPRPRPAGRSWRGFRPPGCGGWGAGCGRRSWSQPRRGVLPRRRRERRHPGSSCALPALGRPTTDYPG